MSFVGRMFAVFIVIALLGSWIGKYVWIPIALVVLYYLIRWCADIFWWGRDEGKW
jgi:hypothetical protein